MSNPVTKRLSQVASVVTPPAVSMVATLAKNDPTAFLGPVGSAVAKNPKKVAQAATSLFENTPAGAATTFIAGQPVVKQFGKQIKQGIQSFTSKACNH
ncbi:MAG: hypothetical protein HEQ32_07405 [Vampirovibrio sp.]